MARAYDRRLQLLALAGGVPAVALSAWLLSRTPWPWAWRAALLALAASASLLAAVAVRRTARRPLHTLSNLLGALREGDFSFRARAPRSDDALGAVFLELNTLAELLQQQRIRALEATALLRTVMEEIDVAIFAFDEEARLRLVNRAGESLLGLPGERLLGETAAGMGLQAALDGESPRFIEPGFPGHAGRFELRRSTFRQGGRPHQLLVLSDLTRPLREEERQAWQRLIRVLSHEINNSLAPLQSLSESLQRIVERREADWLEDTRQGLAIIGSRSQALRRFMDGYARLARLPAPKPATVDLPALVRKVATLETRAPVRVEEGPAVLLQADGDQVEQALINLLKNASEASLETGGQVVLRWFREGAWIVLELLDEGPGLPGGGNLFVPFFTTKPGGTGIGLVLSRQIAEAHGGSLTLENRAGTPGARAVLRLPAGP